MNRMSLISVLTTILIVLILSLIVGSIAGFRGGLYTILNLDEPKHFAAST